MIGSVFHSERSKINIFFIVCASYRKWSSKSHTKELHVEFLINTQTITVKVIFKCKIRKCFLCITYVK